MWITGNDLWIFFRTDVLFFFYMGGLVRMRGWPIEIGWRATLVFLAIYLALVAIRASIPCFLTEPTYLLYAATRGMRLFGVIACWGLFLKDRPPLDSEGWSRATAGWRSSYMPRITRCSPR